MFSFPNANLLQIGAGITSLGKVYYKLGQILLQVGAGITNWGKFLQIRAQKHVGFFPKLFKFQSLQKASSFFTLLIWALKSPANKTLSYSLE